MNWAYLVTPDGNVALRRLSVNEQEAVYDLLEDLIDDADALPQDVEHEHVGYANAGGAVRAFLLTLYAASRSRTLYVFDVE